MRWKARFRSKLDNIRGDTAMLSYRYNATPTSFPKSILPLFAFLILLLQSAVCNSSDILLGTGEPGTFSYFTGKAICQVLQRQHKELSCKPVPGKTATDNLTNLGNDSIDLALVSSKTIYDAFHQSGAFKYINIDYDNLRLLMPIYRSPVALVARKDAGIQRLNDLKGKRVNDGERNSLENLVFQQVKKRKNWQDSSFSLLQSIPTTMSQNWLALRNGTVQAMLYVGMHPDVTLKQLLAEGGTRLIALHDKEVEKIISERVGFCRCTIPAATYPTLKEDLTTLGIETLLISSSATDAMVIEQVLAALHSYRKQLRHAHPALLRHHTTVSVLNSSYLHPHPSALLFFQATKDLY